MSTRCQVKVVQEGLDWGEAVTLYHHTDGYPSNILGLLQKAYRMGVLAGEVWRLGRAGKAASYICAADPGIFEPEEGHERHGDIDYYYVLHVINRRRSFEEEVEWRVDVEDVGNKTVRGVELMTLDVAEIQEFHERFEE